MNFKYIVNSDKYSNVKELLKVEFKLSERMIIKLKKEKRIFLNNSPVYISAPLNIHDVIQIDMDFVETTDNIQPTQMNLKIIYEDEYLLILNKPAGLPIHPSANHFSDSLSNGVKYYFDTKNLAIKLRPVNRLDKDTSGIVIFAKHPYIQECLINQMKDKKFCKNYLALVSGIFSPKNGTINAPITRKDNSIIERTIDLSSTLDKEQAITHYKTLEILKNASLVEFTLETGRTHQIRVHSKFMNCPLIGDTLYGNPSTLISHQALHAYKISFYHPITNEFLEFTTQMPEDFKEAYLKLQIS